MALNEMLVKFSLYHILAFAKCNWENSVKLAFMVATFIIINWIRAMGDSIDAKILKIHIKHSITPTTNVQNMCTCIELPKNGKQVKIRMEHEYVRVWKYSNENSLCNVVPCVPFVDVCCLHFLPNAISVERIIVIEMKACAQG